MKNQGWIENKKCPMNDTANICYDSGNCVTCHYFDSDYHGGYCDKHRCDTDPGATCRDYWRK